MQKDTYNKLFFLLCVIVILGITIVSRACGLTYNLSIHPDESEFYIASSSLAQSLLDPSVPYVEEKEYPEGGYILQLPFQLLRELVGSSRWFWASSQCWNRLSSVFYFVLATVYGILILTNYMSRSKPAAILYALTMCFSMFFIEHSRYGVGDMGSLFLLMATIYHSARALQTKNLLHLAAAFACTGILGAVKYPQIFFILIPGGAYLRMCGKDRKKATLGMLAFALLAVLSLLMFSPKAAVDPAYFLRVLDREGKAYVTEGTGYDTGGVINHVICTVLYTLLYSDFPLSFLLVVVYFSKSVAKRSYDSETDYLFQRWLPIVGILFFSYNMFTGTLVFRTLTPYFGMTALYSSEVAGKLYTYRDKKGHKPGRAIVLLLTCLMIVRGGWLLQMTGHQGDEKDRFTTLFTASVDENWNKVTLLKPYNVATAYSFDFYMECPPDLSVTTIDLKAYAEENNGVAMRPGELVVTGAYDYWLAAPHFIPRAKDETVEIWEAFKQTNQDYYVGQIYPSGSYYLFGAWIRCGTLGQFMMPCNMVYYRSA
ncbi:MAG: glycosyltransferase family 39 protein [Oscillospiraceae bacterium]|nr:glycosyltransferase family 39 protein [Oscillospiraceae bacterium]